MLGALELPGRGMLATGDAGGVGLPLPNGADEDDPSILFGTTGRGPVKFK